MSTSRLKCINAVADLNLPNGSGEYFTQKKPQNCIIIIAVFSVITG